MREVGEEVVWPGLKVARFENSATPQRDAVGGIAVSGSVIILR